ncbi:MAG: ABC transporter substrate-binding protein [Bacteroidales bacterium]|uniref:ABC transporter substrate-binding protein n=1 Tax=Porphyromonas sp. TaxID=1924944 RepID=UPI00297573C9|nr:ABC transporter substrate-binding protein [Porphyromonas sp.]MDD7438038.1 ABC transporter substrate-binding protein [Bacteroidales bacterium]MDY3067820.1 ABC transporter substrate-binding protein [Porphyromonas sp.]
MKAIITSLMLLIFLLSSCGEEERGSMQSTLIQDESIKYARGLSIEQGDGFTLVDISDPIEREAQVYHYALVPRGTTPQGIPSEYEVIETPVRRVIVMTTLQLSNFIKLDAVDRVVGMPSTRFLFNPTMRAQLESGETKRIGIEGNFDTELIMALQPDIILVSPFKRGGYDVIKNLNIPLVTFLGYKETTPLGQAEWLKFTALLLGIEEQANEKFARIETKYNELKALVTDKMQRPKVLSGELHGGNWYVVGGESYLAHQFEDAGADYFMKGNEESGGFYVDFETVYSQAANADYWRIANSYPDTYSYEVLKQTDARYADFRAFKERKVLYCNLNERPFYELSPVEPENVLADLIKIFHPELLPNHQPVFYELLTLER